MPSLSALAFGLSCLAASVSGHAKYVPLNPNGNNTGVAAIGHVDTAGGGKTNQ